MTIRNAKTVEFVRQHRHDDVRQLAFLGDKHPEVDLTWALNQIRGRQIAENKLPTWASRDGIIYPPHLSMEQCSSEVTARYKQSIMSKKIRKKSADSPQTLVDLTGGFGVDFCSLAQLFDEAIYVEQLPHLCEVAKHNFALLGLNNTTVKNGDSIDFLNQMPYASVIFIDPARRDIHGRKTYSIKDCTPNVAALCPLLLEKCDWLMVKLSPMLDWHEAVREMQGVCEVHIVSANNECKELLLICSSKHDQPLTIYCVNNHNIFTFRESATKNQRTPSFANTPAPPSQLLSPHSRLLIPNASIMKAGCFAELCDTFSLQALSPNSHLFVPLDENADFELFPGHIFIIDATTTMNKHELKKALAGISRANIAVRNFPLSAEQLRKRLKLKDGGDIFIFGTTLHAREHILIIAKKVR